MAHATCLAAAGLLPRLEYNAVSNLPGGYPDQAASAMPSLTDWGFLKDWDRVLLRPRITLADPSHEATARALVEQAHAECFIANSTITPVHIDAEFQFDAAPR